MAQLNKEMKILFRNNVERQRLEDKISKIHIKQIQQLEQSSNDIRKVNAELQRLRQSSGRSRFGVMCSRREAYELLQTSDVTQTKWQDSRQSTSVSELPARVGVAKSAGFQRQRRNTLALGEHIRFSSAASLRQQPKEARSFRQLSSITNSLPNHPAPTSLQRTRTCRVSERDSPETDEMPDDYTDNYQDVLKMRERERRSVRRATIVLKPEDVTFLSKKPGYVPPHERYKYDVLTSRRLMFLRRSFSAESTAGANENPQIRGTFSSNSRKSALDLLVEMNKQQTKRSTETRPNINLQLRLEQFLKTGTEK